MDIPGYVLQEGALRFEAAGRGLQFLGGTDGLVYEYEASGRMYVIKYEITSEERIPAIHEKFAFLNYLAQNGVAIARPQLSSKGNLVEIVPYEDHYYTVTSSLKAPGQHVDARDPLLWTAEFIRRWGSLLGQMHQLASSYPAWRIPPKRSKEPKTVVQDWRAEVEYMTNWCQDPVGKQVWLRLKTELEVLPQTRQCYGLIHNDLHPWNMLYDGHTLTVIDFDVLSYHWFMTDVAISIFHGLWQQRHEQAPNQKEFLDCFLSGYFSRSPLDQNWLKHLSLFLRYRQTLLYTVFPNVWGEEREPWQDWTISDLQRRVHEDRPIIEL
jgi:Ser/Thr protein kinase RdoA (MazF antagonist)